MFLVSAALVGVAIVLLVVGIITATLMLVYLAIGVSVVSMILLGLGIFLQRELLWGRQRRRSWDAGTSDAELEPVGAASAAAGTGPAAAARPGGEYPRDDDGPSALRADEAPADELVYVLPGRRRYHRPGCASLTGRTSEELTIGEAREEGFSACTACFPAEAAGTPDAAGEPALAEPAVAGTAADEAGGVAAEALVTPAHGIPVVQSAAQASGPGGAEATGAGPAEPAQATAGGGRAEPGQPGAQPGAGGGTVWVVRGVSRYHRSDCVLIRSVDDDDVDTMTQADAEATGCTPCRACHIVDEPLAR